MQQRNDRPQVAGLNGPAGQLEGGLDHRKPKTLKSIAIMRDILDLDPVELGSGPTGRDISR